MLDQYNPEIVIMMLGTNDVSQNRTTAAFKTDLEDLIGHILYQGWVDATNAHGALRGAVPIISTLSPKNGQDVTPYNTEIVNLCTQYHLPIIDFYGEIMQRQPINWLGTLIDYKAPNWDGIHPSADGGGYNQASDPYASGGAALAQSGYLLRDYLSVQKVKSVKAQVIDGAPGPLVISTNSPLPDGFVSTPYSQTLQAAGGTPPYTWTVFSGSLAPLSLSGAGVITGTPTSATTLTFTARVTDNAAAHVDKVFTITITSGGAPVTVTLDVVKDTYINSAAGPPDLRIVNYGTADNMSMGGDNGQPGWTRISLLEFDLSGIPSGATVTSATLKVWCNNDNRGGNVSVQKVLQSWTETGATWNTRDGSTAWTGGNFLASGNWSNTTLAAAGGRTPLTYTDGAYTLSSIINGKPDSEVVLPNDAGYNAALDDWEYNQTGGTAGILFDITSLVSNWVSSGVNNGLAMCQTGKLTRDGTTWVPWGYSDVTWFTKEFATPGYAPQLTIIYEGGTPDTDAPVVTVSKAILKGTVSDNSLGLVQMTVAGVSLGTLTGAWTSQEVTLNALPASTTIPVIGTDASDNARTVNVMVGP
jgi:hypothetical protein